MNISRLEEQIGELTNLHSIHRWNWHGEPLSLLSRANKDLRISTGPYPPPPSSWEEVDLLILKSSTEDCLSSESEYIRECKRWFLSFSLEDNIRFIMSNILNLESYPWQGSPSSLDISEKAIYEHFRTVSYSLYAGTGGAYTPYTDEQNKQFARRNFNRIVLVDRTIFLSSDNIALTSAIAYIRECKKWFIDNKRDILSNVIYYEKYRPTD